jgi:aminoglycoside phosphotransferase (APT) family kinase protein
VRLPRRTVAVELLANEQRWLPSFAARLPLPVPAPVAIGLPGNVFPWPWSVAPWIEGQPADIDLAGADQGPALAAFLRALHSPALEDAPVNPVRGVPLAVRAERIGAVIARVKSTSHVVTRGVERAWAEGLKAEAAHERVWLHGDLHARNVLVRGGVLAGVIDWGDMCGGDAATDLLSVWTLLGDQRAREAAIRDYAPSPSLLARAMGWAVLFGVTLYDHLRNDDPRHAAGAEACLQRVADDI